MWRGRGPNPGIGTSPWGHLQVPGQGLDGVGIGVGRQGGVWEEGAWELSQIPALRASYGILYRGMRDFL